MAYHQQVAFSSQRLWASTGSTVVFIAVAIGAFGAHIVSENILPSVYAGISPSDVSGFSVPASYKAYLNYQTAVFYQIIHGAGIIMVGLLGRRGKARLFSYAAGISFLLGVVLFCGPLYLMSVTGAKGLHMIVPLGGLCFLAGWVFFLTAAVMPRTQESHQ